MSRRRTGRRSTGAAVYSVFAFLLVAFLTVLGTSAFLKIMKVDVVGASRYSDEIIIEVSGISAGDNMLFVDTGEAINRIHSAMPYVSSVQITRVPPDTIRIEVEESVALATIIYRDEVLVIDSTGRVLQRAGSIPDGLIEVRGFTPSDPEEGSLMKAEFGSETQLRYLTEVLAAIEEAKINSDVPYLDVSNISYITFGYKGRFTVILGGSNNARNKLNQLTTSIVIEIETREPDGVTGTINMSDPTGRYTWNADA